MVTPFRHLSRAVGLALLIGAIVFATSRGISQDVSAIARADSSTITIGDWLNVYLEISHPAEVTLGTGDNPFAPHEARDAMASGRDALGPELVVNARGPVGPPAGGVRRLTVH